MLVALTRAGEVLLAPAESQRLSQRVAVLGLELAAVSLLLVAYAWVYLTHGMRLDSFFTSDTLYIPALMRDLLAEGGSYSDWHLTPSPYFFPDWPMYLVAYAVADGGHYYTILVFSIFQFALIYLLLRAIYGEVFKDIRAIACALASMALLVSVSLDAVPFLGDLRLSGHHAGSFVGLLAGVWLALRILRSDKIAMPVVVALGILAFLMGLSDALFVLQFGLPALIAADYLWRRKEITARQFLCVGLLPAISSFAGTRFTLMAMPHDHDFFYRFGLEYFDKNVDRLEVLIRVVFEADILPALIIPLFYIVLLGAFLWHAIGGRVLRQDLAASHALAFAVALMLVLLPVILLINIDIPGRYVIPVFAAPLALFFVPFVLVRRPLLMLLAPALVGGLAAGSIAMTVAPNGFDFENEFYPGEVECLDRILTEKGLTNGISQYWTAKRVTELSRADLKIVSVHNHLGDHRWIISDAWYRDTYDFALVEERAEPGLRLDAKKLVTLNGEPAFKEQCGFITIYGYERDTMVTSERKP